MNYAIKYKPSQTKLCNFLDNKAAKALDLERRMCSPTTL